MIVNNLLVQVNEKSTQAFQNKKNKKIGSSNDSINRFIH